MSVGGSWSTQKEPRQGEHANSTQLVSGLNPGPRCCEVTLLSHPLCSKRCKHHITVYAIDAFSTIPLIVDKHTQIQTIQINNHNTHQTFSSKHNIKDLLSTRKQTQTKQPRSRGAPPETIRKWIENKCRMKCWSGAAEPTGWSRSAICRRGEQTAGWPQTGIKTKLDESVITAADFHLHISSPPVF